MRLIEAKEEYSCTSCGEPGAMVQIWPPSGVDAVYLCSTCIEEAWSLLHPNLSVQDPEIAELRAEVAAVQKEIRQRDAKTDLLRTRLRGLALRLDELESPRQALPSGGEPIERI